MHSSASPLSTQKPPSLSASVEANGSSGAAVQPLLANTWVWWVVFTVASVCLSWVFETFKGFTVTPSLYTGLRFGGACLLMLLGFLTLGYDSYIKEKLKDNVHRPIALFEWLYQQQNKRSHA